MERINIKRLILLASLILSACGPSKEEIEARDQINSVNKSSNTEVKDIYICNSYRIVEIDHCQYIILRGQMMLHKANCTNHSEKEKVEIY